MNFRENGYPSDLENKKTVADSFTNSTEFKKYYSDITTLFHTGSDKGLVRYLDNTIQKIRWMHDAERHAALFEYVLCRYIGTLPNSDKQLISETTKDKKTREHYLTIMQSKRRLLFQWLLYSLYGTKPKLKNLADQAVVFAGSPEQDELLEDNRTLAWLDQELADAQAATQDEEDDLRDEVFETESSVDYYEQVNQEKNNYQQQIEAKNVLPPYPDIAEVARLAWPAILELRNTEPRPLFESDANPPNPNDPKLFPNKMWNKVEAPLRQQGISLEGSFFSQHRGKFEDDSPEGRAAYLYQKVLYLQTVALYYKLTQYWYKHDDIIIEVDYGLATPKDLNETADYQWSLVYLRAGYLWPLGSDSKGERARKSRHNEEIRSRRKGIVVDALNDSGENTSEIMTMPDGTEVTVYAYEQYLDAHQKVDHYYTWLWNAAQKQWYTNPQTLGKDMWTYSQMQSEIQALMDAEEGERVPDPMVLTPEELALIMNPEHEITDQEITKLMHTIAVGEKLQSEREQILEWYKKKNKKTRSIYEKISMIKADPWLALIIQTESITPDMFARHQRVSGRLEQAVSHRRNVAIAQQGKKFVQRAEDMMGTETGVDMSYAAMMWRWQERFQQRSVLLSTPLFSSSLWYHYANDTREQERRSNFVESLQDRPRAVQAIAGAGLGTFGVVVNTLKSPYDLSVAGAKWLSDDKYEAQMIDDWNKGNLFSKTTGIITTPASVMASTPLVNPDGSWNIWSLFYKTESAYTDFLLMRTGARFLSEQAESLLVRAGVVAEYIPPSSDVLGKLWWAYFGRLDDNLTLAINSGLTWAWAAEYAFFASSVDGVVESLVWEKLSGWYMSKYLGDMTKREIVKRFGYEVVGEISEELLTNGIMDLTHLGINQTFQTVFQINTVDDYLETIALTAMTTSRASWWWALELLKNKWELEKLQKRASTLLSIYNWLIENMDPTDWAIRQRLINTINALVSAFTLPEQSIPTLLPPSSLDALQHRQAQFGKSEITDLLHPKFGDLWFYFACKYTDAGPQQDAVIDAYLTFQSSDKTATDQADYQAAVTNALEAVNDPTRTINAAKAAQVSRQWFDLFNMRGTLIFDRCRKDGRTPVVMLYAGLLMMESARASLKKTGDKVFFLDPHQNGDPNSNYHGWVLERQADGTISYTAISPSQTPAEFLRGVSHITLIDDTIGTGKSLESLKRRLRESLGAGIDIRADAAIRWWKDLVSEDLALDVIQRDLEDDSIETERIRKQANSKLDKSQKVAPFKEQFSNRQTPDISDIALQELIEVAHQVGSGEKGKDGTPAKLYNYTPEQLARKMRILIDGWLTIEQASWLIREWYCGKTDTDSNGRQYDIFDTEMARAELYGHIVSVSDYIRTHGIKNLVLFDRSMRPMALGLMRYWNLEGRPRAQRPKIYFVNPMGFKSKEMYDEEEARYIIDEQNRKGNACDPFSLPESFEDIQTEFQTRYKNLYLNAGEPTLLLDTCIHSWDSAAPVLMSFSASWFTDLMFGTINPVRPQDWPAFRPWITFARRATTCYPFGRDRMTQKSFELIPRPNPASTGKELDDRVRSVAIREEVRDIVNYYHALNNPRN